MSSNSITLTTTAVNKVQQLLSEEGNPDLKLRVYIVGGGCSGFQYGFSFDDTQNEDDMVISTEHDGIGLVVDAMSFNYLIGAEIDYVESLQGAHFKVENPNAKTTCGCGSSFSIE